MFIPEIPNNNLKSQLEELISIVKKLETTTTDLRVKFKFNPPASEEEILNFENAFNISLPVGYKEFLLFSNGAQLCGHTAEFDDINSIVNLNQAEISPDFPEDYVVIADIIGDGELLCFSKTSKKFIRYFDGDETIFDNFYDVFKIIIKRIKSKAADYIDF